jgi:hypothetical protein
VSNFGADTALVSGCSLVGRAAVNLSTWTRQLLDFEVVDVSERMDLPLRSRGEGKARMYEQVSGSSSCQPIPDCST